MTTDMLSRLGDADRSLHKDTRDGQEVWVLVVEKDYAAPPEEADDSTG